MVIDENRAAYHESGHAVVAYCLKLKIDKISIIPLDDEHGGHCTILSPPVACQAYIKKGAGYVRNTGKRTISNTAQKMAAFNVAGYIAHVLKFPGEEELSDQGSSYDYDETLSNYQIDLGVDTHEQSSWYFITQASLALNPDALDARRTSVSSPFPPQLWRQNILATKPHFLSNTAVLAKRTFSSIHYLYAALSSQLHHSLHIWAVSPSPCEHDLPVSCISLSHNQAFLLLSSEKVLLNMH